MNQLEVEGTTVEPSPIHGRGLFATRVIAKGTHIGTYLGPPARRDGDYVLWILEDDGTETGINGKNDLRFVNHSYEPNAEFDGEELFATRDISPGEEITAHYGDAWKP